MRWYAAHAYTANETPVYGGGIHAVCLEDVDEGRIQRKKGNTLCVPSRKFWGLVGVEKSREVTCKRCRELLRRFGESVKSSETQTPEVAQPVVPQEGTDPGITLKDALARIFRTPT